MWTTEEYRRFVASVKWWRRLVSANPQALPEAYRDRRFMWGAGLMLGIAKVIAYVTWILFGMPKPMGPNDITYMPDEHTGRMMPITGAQVHHENLAISVMFLLWLLFMRTELHLSEHAWMNGRGYRMDLRGFFADKFRQGTHK